MGTNDDWDIVGNDPEFIEPERLDEFRLAWRALVYAILEEMGVVRLVDWLAKKLR